MFISMKYPVTINKTEYGYDAHCPVFPGCHSQGDTFEEAMENIKDAIKTYLLMIAQETRDSTVYQVEVEAPVCNAVY
jgi:predicted RNase H-like HicB family nuclease